MKTQAVEMRSQGEGGQDSLSSEAWIINLFPCDDADGLNAVSKRRRTPIDLQVMEGLCIY